MASPVAVHGQPVICQCSPAINDKQCCLLFNDHLATNYRLGIIYGGQNVARLKIEPQHNVAMAQSVTLQVTETWELYDTDPS